MKRTMVLSLCILLLLLGSCGGSASSMSDLQKANEDLKSRVKALEDELLQVEKKQIQHEQAMQQMHERLKEMETAVDKIRLGPTR